MTSAIPPTPALPITPAAPSHTEGASGNASAGGPSFAASAQAATQGHVPAPPSNTRSASSGLASTPATSPTPPANAAAPTTPVAPASGTASAAQVAQIVAATQAALSSSVNLSPQAQQAVKMDAFNQLVANLVNHIQSGSATLPANWPAAGVSPQLQAFVTALLQQATASQPLPQQLVSLQAWPTALTNAVLQLAGQAATAGNLSPALAATTTQAAPAADPTDIRLPQLQNWLVQQGSVQAADGERSFTLTLRVPVAWAQAQAALGTALPAGASPVAAGSAIPPGLLSGTPGGFSLGGLLALPFAGSVQQLSSGSMGLVMQPQLLPGSAAAVAAQAMRTSAILQLEFQPLAQAVQSAQMASVYMPAHMLPQDLQAMIQGRSTDPWLLMAQAEAEGHNKKQPRNANEQANFCNRAGCQYQGRAICAQPFCAEMNYLWSIDRAQRRTL
ncbi:MAG: hypothetical protein RSB86_00495 [Comamonas sp.]|uniref:hypothetical protein n=1 Tax=Comamonas sp. TaxID=34028 RepID=UPI002FC94C42